MDCILKRCAHGGQAECKILGQCGAAYALDRARSECGYEVYAKANPTLAGLRRAGLITESGFNGRTVVLRARPTA